MTKKPNIKWYSLDEILKYDVQYYMIFGERSNGKSYAVDRYVIDRYFLYGEEFALVKRYEDDIKSTYMENLFPKELLEYARTEYNHVIKFYRGKWLVHHVDEEKPRMMDCEVFGRAFSLSNVNRTKATTYPNITTILFEEFMSIKSNDYLTDELNLFLNLVSTIARYRHNLKIFMLANAISKFSPYSSALGIKLHRIKKGEIILRSYKDKKGFTTNFAIERSENVNVFDNNMNESKIVYNNFGNSGVGSMITSGEFETHAYPRSVDTYTFSEIRQHKRDKLFTKKHQLPIILRYEDYYYRIYLVQDGKFILGLREVENGLTNIRNVRYIINGIKYIPGAININNLAYYDDEQANRIINIIVACMRQKDFVTMTDDDGENVVNGFRLSGITL